VGIDGVHFGVISILIIQIGALTPPFGILVYAVAGTAKDVPLFDIFRGTIPFIIAMFVCLALVIFIPQISLFLPSTMFPPVAG
jgi:TRAP-type C4-dicarboxylate transport system permease large subunit